MATGPDSEPITTGGFCPGSNTTSTLLTLAGPSEERRKRCPEGRLEAAFGSPDRVLRADCRHTCRWTFPRVILPLLTLEKRGPPQR